MFAALGRKKVEQSLSKMKRFQSLAEDENIVPRVSVSDLCEFNDTIKIAKKRQVQFLFMKVQKQQTELSMQMLLFLQMFLPHRNTPLFRFWPHALQKWAGKT